MACSNAGAARFARNRAVGSAMNRPNGEAGTGDTGVAGRATQALTGAADTITKYGTNTGTTGITTYSTVREVFGRSGPWPTITTSTNPGSGAGPAVGCGADCSAPAQSCSIAADAFTGTKAERSRAASHALAAGHRSTERDSWRGWVDFISYDIPITCGIFCRLLPGTPLA